MSSSIDIPLIPTQYHTCSSENLLTPDFAAAVTKLWWSQAIIYGVILFYIFAGMVIISDIFMLSIEEITSQTRANGNKIWNASVANLTLMALGSSSHEIFLTLVETVGSGFESRELGTGSIIGSAAFNLMIVSAGCVTALKEGEVKKIKQFKVFVVTSFFSVFAYLWMFLVLTVISPNVIELWEAVLTFSFFPIMVLMAFVTDKNFFRREETEKPENKPQDDSKSRTSFLSEWKEQFTTFFGDKETSTTSYITSLILLPWNALFAFLPPPRFLNGYLTFVLSLVVIGIQVTIVSDVATTFGCLIGLEKSVNSITVVALGSSLPDLFVSRAAVRMESTADNAIGNVTRSNSFNVFVGLGLPWLLAAIHWKIKEGNHFAVPSQNLGFSVGVYTALATLSVVILVLRRFMVGGEVGGSKSWALFSSFLLLCLWMTYVTLSSLHSYQIL